MVGFRFSRLLRSLLDGIRSFGVVSLLVDQLPIKEVPINTFENREFLEKVLGYLDSP